MSAQNLRKADKFLVRFKKFSSESTVWCFDFVALSKSESFRLCKLHKTKGILLVILTSTLRQNPGICAYSPLLLLYYNKLHQKNQDVFFKIVLTAQFCFYIICLVSRTGISLLMYQLSESFRSARWI